VQLANPTGDQLCVLGSEVDDQNGVVIGRALRLTHVMERRGMTRFGIAFVLTLLASLVLLGSSTSTLAWLPEMAVPVDTVPDRPPVTVSEFFPDEQNLSDCLGLVERPGCGSEARGGWRQTVVFGVIIVGLGLIFWRISRGIKANRSEPPPAAPR